MPPRDKLIWGSEVKVKYLTDTAVVLIEALLLHPALTHTHDAQTCHTHTHSYCVLASVRSVFSLSVTQDTTAACCDDLALPLMPHLSISVLQSTSDIVCHVLKTSLTSALRKKKCIRKCQTAWGPAESDIFGERCDVFEFKP